MAICSFFQRGNCRFGDNCKFEHPWSNTRNSGGGFGGGANNNRFGAFNSGDRYRPNEAAQTSNRFSSNSRDAKAPLFHLDKEDIKNDLTNQRPIYPLSCYGPGRDAPRQLIEGPVEISPEELRVRYYGQRLSGNENGAQQEESALNDKMQQQVQSILNDIEGAVRYVEEGANVHPNRIDIAKGNGGPNGLSNGPSTTSNPFSSAPANSSQTPANPFLKAPTASFGQSSTPGFGQPAFGQASNPGQTAAPAFGQASKPGQVAPAFGQASNPGQAAPGFGAASSLGAKPSPFSSAASAGAGGAFGKPAFGTSGFGQASMPGSGSAIGQAGILGQKPAFGQASPAGPAAPFGQASPMGQQGTAFGKPAFGQSGFGQTSQPGAGAPPFGQAAQSSASPFAQPTSGQAATPFGSTQAQTSSGQANPFGSTAAQSGGVFGQPARPTTSGSPFGGQHSQQTPAQGQNPFQQKTLAPSATSGPGTSPFGTQGAQPAAPFGQQAASLVAPGTAKEIDPKDRFKEGKPEEYEGEQGKILEEIYRRVGQMGRFNDDEEIPLVPPKCEWIVQMPL